MWTPTPKPHAQHFFESKLHQFRNAKQTKITFYRMELPTQAPIEAFTMSVDRGYLGRAPGDNNPNMYRSMDDLTAQKATGLELVRLLRVSNFFCAVEIQNECIKEVGVRFIQKE